MSTRQWTERKSPRSEPANLKLEAVVISVADADFSLDNGFSVVQFTDGSSWLLQEVTDYMVRDQSGQAVPV